MTEPTEQSTSTTPKLTEDGRPIRTVKQWRMLRGLTIRQLAKAANVALSTIQNIEGGSGNPRAETTKMLGVALEVRTDQITEVRRAIGLDD